MAYFIVKIIITLSRPFRFLIGLFVLSALVACQLPGLGGGGPAANIRNPVKIALLLPNGGSDPGLNFLGDSMLRASNMALADFNTDEVELMPFSTGGNPAMAAQAAANAQAAGANLIIGPLTSTEVASVSAATNLNVLSFSNNAEVAGGNVFLLGTTFEVIADRVLAFASAQGKVRFGVVATDDLSGGQAARAITTSAARNQIQIATVQTYPALSLNGIKSRAGAIAETLRASSVDAVMFTDTPTGGFGFMANEMASHGFTSQSAQYFGISRWDASRATLVQANLEGGYFAIPDPAKVAAFNSRYNAVTGVEPHALSGLAYDGVKLAIELVRKARGQLDITPFGADNLRSISVDGSNGTFRFNNRNHAARALAVLQVRDGEAVVVSLAQ